MITLLRWAFWLCALGSMGYFAATVPLGQRTLLGHLRAIASTPEARELGEGAREEAGKVAERVRQQLQAGDGGEAHKGTGAPGGGGAPAERLDDKDRKALDRMVRERTGSAPR